MSAGFDVVTGAFSYTGRHIARRLLAAGRAVRTLTGHPDRPGADPRIAAFPYDFDRPERLVAALRGARTLYNTYWVRFDRGAPVFDAAVRNSAALFRAAAEAGVARVVHVSVSRADAAPDLPYYRGKAEVEEELKACGVPYAILRPTLVFGDEDILVNNIAWMIRRFPVFPVFGSRRFPVQPVFVGDVAALAVEAGAERGSFTRDAAGPRLYEYAEMIAAIGRALGRRVWSPRFGRAATVLSARVLGLALGDVVLTGEEYDGLTRGLLRSDEPPRGRVAFEDWLAGEGAGVGASYRSELRRHFLL